MSDHDPMLDGITRWTAFESLGGLFQGMNKRPTGKYVLFSDLPALIEKVREDERQRVTSGFAEYLRHMEEWQAGYNKGHTTGVEQGQRDERERIDSAVMPILATLARHACTAENWEQTDALTRRSVTDVKAAIRAREEQP